MLIFISVPFCLCVQMNYNDFQKYTVRTISLLHLYMIEPFPIHTDDGTLRDECIGVDVFD